jgi:hypothetical protein
MSLGLVGRKVGMTRVFSDDGVSTPVTVIEVEPNRISQIKTVENDGYTAVQVISGSRRASRVTKPMAGHYRKAGIEKPVSKLAVGPGNFVSTRWMTLSSALKLKPICSSRGKLSMLLALARARVFRAV